MRRSSSAPGCWAWRSGTWVRVPRRCTCLTDAPVAPSAAVAGRRFQRPMGRSALLLAARPCRRPGGEGRERRPPDGARARQPALLRAASSRSAIASRSTRRRRWTAPASAALVRSADVVIEASRPRALAGWGLSAEMAAAEGGGLAEHHRVRPQERRPHRLRRRRRGRGAGWPDCVAAIYEFVGDAIADPLTGLAGAVAVMRAFDAGGGQLIDLSMASVAHSTLDGTFATDLPPGRTARPPRRGARSPAMPTACCCATCPARRAPHRRPAAQGTVVQLGTLSRLPGEEVLDGGGAALSVGLADHHLHLLAMAAAHRRSTCARRLHPTAPPSKTALQRAAPDGAGWIRAVGYAEQGGRLTIADLDRLQPAAPCASSIAAGRCGC